MRMWPELIDCDTRKVDYSVLASWCGDRGYDLREWIPVLRNAIRTVTCRRIDDLQRLPELLDVIVNIEDAERLIWIRNWTIWSDRSQDIGLRALDLVTNNLSEPERGIDSQVYILAAAEWREAIALLVLPMLFGWDAHLLFGSGAVAVDISHHGRIDVSFSSESVISSEKMIGL